MVVQSFLTSVVTVVETDACLTGCGGICGLYFFHTVFPQFISVQELHINALELLTILIACKIWGKYWKGKRIQINCDNSSSDIYSQYRKVKRCFHANMYARNNLHSRSV